MPTYEFGCPQGHRFERFYRKIADAPTELACAECDAVATRRISGGAGLLFKGSGFYITDYGKGGQKPDASPNEKKETTGASDAGSSAGGAKTDGAPATSEKPKKASGDG